MIHRFALLCLLLCSACIQLGGEPQPTRYYLLESMDVAAVSSRQLSIELGPIVVPDYLDRPQIVSRSANNQILLADQERWAEPLPENLTRTLRENLQLLLKNARINTAPWNNGVKRAYTVKLTINRFEGIIDEQTDVDIRWSLFAPGSNEEIARRHFQAQVPIGHDYQELVVGLSKSLAQLSRDISIAILAHE